VTKGSPQTPPTAQALFIADFCNKICQQQTLHISEKRGRVDKGKPLTHIKAGWAACPTKTILVQDVVLLSLIEGSEFD
jgi:hypothetical protein